MNNFVFSQGGDPLLYTSPLSIQTPQSDLEMRQRLDNAMVQYQEMQRQFLEKQSQIPQASQPQVKDRLGELDEIMKDLDNGVIEKLNQNAEYLQLNVDIQNIIQAEIMSSVRWKINENPNAISKIDKLKDVIKDVKKEVALEEKKSMMEINDYLKNFSDMTFDDYKKLKAMTSGNESK
jgi:malate synthase